MDYLAGPSQEFGWIGHGTYAPLDIPNIFKAAGIDTHWNPEEDEIFETGLIYPALTTNIVVDEDPKPTTTAATIKSPQTSVTRPPPSHGTKAAPLENLLDPIDLLSTDSNPVLRFEKSVGSARPSNSIQRENKKKNKTFDLLMDETPAVAPPYEKYATSSIRPNFTKPVSFLFVKNSTESAVLAIESESTTASLGTEFPASNPYFQVQAPENIIQAPEHSKEDQEYVQDLTHLHWAFAQVSEEENSSTKKNLPKISYGTSSANPLYYIPFSSTGKGPQSSEIATQKAVVSDGGVDKEKSDNAIDEKKVLDVFSSPLVGLNLPAVATKLLSDISESAVSTSRPHSDTFIDLDPFSSLEKAIPSFIDVATEESKNIDDTFVDIGTEKSNDINVSTDKDVDEEDIFLVFSENVDDEKVGFFTADFF